MIFYSFFAYFVDKLNKMFISCRNSTEHVFPDSPIIVREDEPSSIIAFALKYVILFYFKFILYIYC